MLVPFLSWGDFGPFPKYCHFTSSTCIHCLQLTEHVYLGMTWSTNYRPLGPCAPVNDVPSARFMHETKPKRLHRPPLACPPSICDILFVQSNLFQSVIIRNMSRVFIPNG